MRTSKNIMGIENHRMELNATQRRIIAVSLALGILSIAASPAHVAHAGTSPIPPVSKCSDFGCEH